MFANLEARALARIQRRLGAHAEPGEQVLAADICRSGKTVDGLLQHRGPKVHVALTGKALYVVERGGNVSRLPITEITGMGFKDRPAPGDVRAAADYRAAGDRARIVVLRMGELGFIAFLPVGRRTVADFAPKLERLLQGQPWVDG